MASGIAPLLVSILPTQAEPAAISGLTLGLVLALAVAILVAAALAVQMRGLSSALAKARAESREHEEREKGLQARERELVKKVEDRNEEVRELKQDLAAIRKKHHASQEEQKELREQLRSREEERSRQSNARPAFEGPTATATATAKPKSTPSKDQPAQEREAAKSREPVAKSADAGHETAAESRTQSAASSELDARIEKLEAEQKSLAAQLDSEREAARAQKSELSRLRRYTEQLRRIDIVSKGKVEVLEDRVAALGRQYYDAVSELAAVKGEVVPPAPRTQRPAKKGARDGAAEPSKGETPEADSLSAEMEAAAREAELAPETSEEQADAGA